MEVIYSKYVFTFAWLGEAYEKSNLATDRIVKIGWLFDTQSRSSLLRVLSMDSAFREADPWIALCNLLRRPFWYRIWIRQKLVLLDILFSHAAPKISGQASAMLYVGG
jgi:hypothetical protein